MCCTVRIRIQKSEMHWVLVSIATCGIYDCGRPAAHWCESHKGSDRPGSTLWDIGGMNPSGEGISATRDHGGRIALLPSFDCVLPGRCCGLHCSLDSWLASDSLLASGFFAWAVRNFKEIKRRIWCSWKGVGRTLEKRKMTSWKPDKSNLKPLWLCKPETLDCGSHSTEKLTDRRDIWVWMSTCFPFRGENGIKYQLLWYDIPQDSRPGCVPVCSRRPAAAYEKPLSVCRW